MPNNYYNAWEFRSADICQLAHRKLWWWLSTMLLIVQSLSRVWLFVTPCTAACQASLTFRISWRLLKLMFIESVMPSNHLVLCCPFLPAFSLSQHQGLFFMSQFFTSGGQSIEASASASFLPINIQGWFPLGLTGLTSCSTQDSQNSLQQHSSKASIFQRSAFFTVQLSQPYMTSGKTIGLTRWTFVGNVMSLLFNILSRFVIAFLPRSKCLLISWLLWCS